jgi:hypothetical protein
LVLFFCFQFCTLQNLQIYVCVHLCVYPCVCVTEYRTHDDSDAMDTDTEASEPSNQAELWLIKQPQPQPQFPRTFYLQAVHANLAGILGQ